MDSRELFCSTVIPTIARPTLARAVQSVLDQEFREVEVIVVNDSGKPLPDEPWQYSPQVRVLETNRRERIFARNSGAAAARGRYLHFLDDDDWLLPGAMESFLRLSQRRNEAHWLYGSSELVDRQGVAVIRLQLELDGNGFVQVMAGEWLPLQASLIRADAFFQSGGFTPLVFATQDVDLARKIGLRGDFAGTSELVACIGMGSAGSSTDYARGPQYSRWAREKILAEPGVFPRLRGSATNGYWHGRIVRTYLTSTVWNLQRKRLFTAGSRLVFGLTGVALAGTCLLTTGFWKALLRPYSSFSFERGFREAALAKVGVES
jgi:glycosyltransferase involved in cell wall biosynthesis